MGHCCRRDAGTTATRRDPTPTVIDIENNNLTLPLYSAEALSLTANLAEQYASVLVSGWVVEVTLAVAQSVLLETDPDIVGKI